MVDSDIRNGRELVRILDRKDFPLYGALWFYFSESDEWRLLLATSLVDEVGPRETYTRVRKVLSQKIKPSQRIPLKRISVLSPGDELIQLLGTVIKTGRTISGTRFRHNTINGILIEDAYVYRLCSS